MTQPITSFSLTLISNLYLPLIRLALFCTACTLVFAGVIANFDAHFVKGKENAMRQQRQPDKVCALCSLL
jgi:hypothetical protein